MVSGRHKLIVDLFKDEIFLELYDTVADPEETMNLAVDPVHDRRVTELLGALGGHMRSTGDLLPVPDPAATLAAFRATPRCAPDAPEPGAATCCATSSAGAG